MEVEDHSSTRLGIRVLRGKSIILISFCFFSHLVIASEALFAGFSFTGQWNQRADLYPYASALADEVGENGLNPLDSALMDSMRGFNSSNLTLVYQQQKNASAGTPVTLAFGLGGESVEEVKSKTDVVVIYRVMTRILAFDWDEKKLIAAFPLQVVYQDVVSKSPSEDERREVFRKMYTDTSFSGNVFNAWREKLSKTQIKDSYGLYFGVSDIAIGEKAAEILNSAGLEAASYQTLVAQTVESTLSDAQGIGIVPFTAGESIGSNMALRFSDATTLNLQLPEPDFRMKFLVTNFRNVEKVKGRVRTIYVAAYGKAEVFLQDEDIKKTYFQGDLKHINKMIFSTSDEVEVDYWSAYQTALRTLLVRFSTQISEQDPKVVKALNPDMDLTSNFKEMLKIVEKCK